MVMAIYNINKKGFISENIHLLKQNITLKIPKESELKNISYLRLRVTSDSDTTTYGYDNTFYPPETGIIIGSLPYKRRVLIQRAREDASGQIETVDPDDGDTHAFAVDDA